MSFGSKKTLLNADAITDFVAELTKQKNTGPFVTKWLQGTFRRYLLAEMPVIQCASVIEMNSPTALMLKSLLGEKGPKFEVLDPELLPEWAQAALAANRLFKILPFPDGAIDTYLHWVDFLETIEGDKPIGYNIRDLKAAVAKWDLETARIKLEGNLQDGVELVDFDFGDPRIYLVRLETRDAFSNETAMMDHCVGRGNGYYERRAANPIYSLRSLDQTVERTDEPVSLDAPLATIEVKNNRVASVKGFHNRAVTPQVGEWVKKWAKATLNTPSQGVNWTDDLTPIWELSREDKVQLVAYLTQQYPEMISEGIAHEALRQRIVHVMDQGGRRLDLTGPLIEAATRLAVDGVIDMTPQHLHEADDDGDFDGDYISALNEVWSSPVFRTHVEQSVGRSRFARLQAQLNDSTGEIHYSVEGGLPAGGLVSNGERLRPLR